MKMTLRLVAAILALFICSLVHATDWSTQDYDLYSGDFDGDGRADILYIAKDPAKVSGIATSPNGAASTAWQSWPSNYLGIPWSSGAYKIIVGDFDGNGRSDLFLQRTTPGDSYVLRADENGKITGIWQTVSYSALGLTWSADQHRIVAGDFTGDGKTDLFLQAVSPGGTNAIVAASSVGQFTSGPLQTWNNTAFGFKWSNANVFSGDFNGDGKWDLLVQAKPTIVMIDFDVPIPVPVFTPNTFGMALSQGGATPFIQAGVQQWSRNAFGADWSPNAANVVVADFNGDGRADVVLQARASGKTSYLLNGNASGTALSSGAAISANVAITGDSARLVAGRFNASGGAGLYIQSVSPGGTNYVAASAGTTISATAHTPLLSAVQPTTLVGHTAGMFGVSDDGSASYRIPIVVPPGVQGLQPDLSLAYSSGAGNSFAGMGWSLGGLSRITRCGWTQEQDGEPRAVTLGSEDRFCLDDNKLRLTSAPGTYGQSGSTYRTEIEQFARITASGSGPSSFFVEAKDGRKLWYGTTEDSRIQAVNSASPSTPHTWLLNQVQDRAGNTMTISYLEDGAPNGSYRPNEILYGAGTAQTYKVKYFWDTRPNPSDYTTDNSLGAFVKETFRLNRIETYYKPYGSGTFQLVHRYQASYQTGGTLRSQLLTLQECDANSRCLSPTTFGWQQAVAGWSSSEVSAATPASSTYAVDFDGDGRTDFLYLKTYNGTLTWHYVKANEAGGFDAEQRTQYIVSNINNAFAVPIKLNGLGRTGLLVNNANFRYFLTWNGTAITNSFPPGTGGLTATPRGLWTGDFNGDGYTDILFAVLTASNTNQFYLQAGGATDFAAPTAYYNMPAIGAANPVDPYDVVKPIDFNGDGKTDLIVQTVSLGNGLNCSPELPECQPYQYQIYHWRAFISTGTTLTQLALSETGGCECTTFPVLPADYNGDGLTDLVAGSYTESSPGADDWTFSWAIRQGSSAAGLSTPTAITLPLTPYLIAGDFTGDGHADIIHSLDFTNWSMTQWTGSAFGTATSTGISSSAPDSVRVLDMNGDNLLDIGYMSAGGYRVRPHNGPIPDLMSSIDDGFGNQVTVTYAALSDNTVYTKGSGAVFPAEDVQPVTPVVKLYVATDGAGGTYTVSEKYFSSRNSLWGRGSLGFAHREETDGHTGFEKVHQWDYRQDFPFIGQPSRDWVVQGTNPTTGAVMTNTAFDYDYLQFGSFPHFRWHPFVKKTTETTYEVGGSLNGQAITEVATTVDSMGSFGVPLSVTAKTKDVQSTSPWLNNVFTRVAVSSDVLNDETNWCVGRARQVTTTDTLYDGSVRTRTAGRTINAAMCRTTDEVSEPSNNPLRVNTHYGFDGCGNVNQVDVTGRNPDGSAMATRTSLFNYSYSTDRCSQPEKITDSLGQISYRTYRHEFGTTASETDPNGLSTTWVYDDMGRRIHEQRPDNTATDWFMSSCTSTNSYCGTGDTTVRSQIQQVDRDIRGSDIGSKIALYNGRGRERRTGTQMSGGVWSYVSKTYDALGRPATRSVPYTQTSNGKHRFTYDLADRPTRDELVTAAGTVDRFTSWAYAGRTQTITDPKTNAGIYAGATSKVFDSLGQLRRVTDPSPGGTTYYDYTYDASGYQVLTIKDPANNSSSMKIDPLGRKTSSDDVDMGHWTFGYNSLGEQVSQTDARNQTVTMGYDPLGRMTTRVEAEGQTDWTWGTSAAARNIGQLEKVTSPGDPAVANDKYKEEYLYDNSGRVQTATFTQGGTYTVDYGYSDQGHLDTVTYPTSTSSYRLKVKYLYSNGQLMQVKDANAGTVFWTLNAIDDAGRAIDVSMGNGLRQISGYDALTGTMTYRQSGSGGSTTNRQNLSFEWDKNNNLSLRRNQLQSPTLTENFYYDTLNRLDYSQLNNVTNLDVTVNSIGNLTYKSDIGNLDYTTAQGACNYTGLTAQPHAVRNAASTAYCYDANGNMTLRGTGNSVQWTSYNLPKQITQGAVSSQFLYGADRNRWKQAATYSGQTETTIYVAGLLEKVTVPTGTAYRHYITFGNEAAIYTRWDTGATQLTYLTQDHLGSTSSITDGNGASVVTESFDAYGQRRNGTTWSGAPPPADVTSISNITRRGFTGHEHLDNLNLIHMNGRVYSPGLGRFMSADPFVPDATDSQSLNRYSYVRNNPLTFTDPTGYITFIEHCTSMPPSRDTDLGPPDDPNTTVHVGATFVPTCTYDIIPDLEPLVPMPDLGLPNLTFEEIKTIVISAWKAKYIDGVAINYNLSWPEEQLWEMLPTGELVLVPTYGIKWKCPGKDNFVGQNKPLDPSFTLNGDIAALHDHPGWALPFPGPEDGANPFTFKIPNFGMSPFGVWVVKPGATLSVELLAKSSWGKGPNGETFNPTAYTKLINTPGTGGKVMDLKKTCTIVP